MHSRSPILLNCAIIIFSLLFPHWTLGSFPDPSISCSSSHFYFHHQILSLNTSCNVFTLTEEGDEALESKNYGQAFLLYTRALSIRPLTPHTAASLYVRRSQTSLHQVPLEVSDGGRSKLFFETIYRIAEGDAQDCIRERPDWWKCYYSLGKIHQRQKNYPAAYKAFNQALGLNPNDRSIKMAKTSLLDKAGDNIEDEVRMMAKRLAKMFITQQLKEAMDEIDKAKHNKVNSILLETYKKISKTNDPKVAALGQVLIGNLYLFGTEGIVLNYQVAATWYKLAVEFSGNPEATFRLALLHMNPSFGIKPDLEFALSALENLAESEPIEPWFEERYSVEWTDGSRKNIREKKTTWIANSQRVLGNLLMTGGIVNLNYTEAARWLKKSMGNGNGDAAHDLAQLYMEGKGVEKNLELAKEYFKMASEDGVSKAKFPLAQIYLKELNVDESESWFQSALLEEDSTALTRQKEFEQMLELTRLKLREIGFKNLGDFQSVEEENEAAGNSISVDKSIQSRFDKAVIKYWSKEGKIQKMAAKEGHLYAQSIVHSMKHLKEGRKLLHSYTPDPDSELPPGDLEEQIVSHLADSLRITCDLLYLSPKEVRKVQMILVNIFRHFDSPAVDINARIVQSYLMGDENDGLLEFLSMSKIKYPEEAFFHLWHAKRLTAVIDFRGSLDELGKSTLLFPQNPNIIFHHIQLLRIFEGGDKLTMEMMKVLKSVFLKFLKMAPKDHEGVPSMNYALAELAMELEKMERSQMEEQAGWWSIVDMEQHKEYLKKLSGIVQKYFEFGKAAEKLMIPPLLPYEHEMGLKARLHEYLENDGRTRKSLKGMLSLVNWDEE